MSWTEHPSWEEDLMPYADGQLQGVQAERVSAHLETCSVCAQAVADAKRLSMQMANWEIEEAPGQLTRSVLAELNSKAGRSRTDLKLGTGWWTRGRVMAYSFAGAFGVLVLVVFAATPSLLRSRQAPPSRPDAANAKQSTADLFELELDQSTLGKLRKEGPAQMQGQGQGQGQGQAQGQGQGQGRQRLASQVGQIEAPAGPMVIRTIRLMLISKEFDAARTRIEAIARDAQGYVDQLSVRSNPGSAKSLSAILRFPSNRVDAGLIELRKLGQSKEESQKSADITGQYADLIARLNNARNTEQRLVAMLRERTGKLQDVIEAEREIARVREEIERMEAEQKTLNNKVQYATVHVELTEEYRAQLETTPPSAGTRVRNAAVAGYGFAVETVLGIILAALTYTPTLLVLAVLLAPLAFLAWRLQARLWEQRN